METNELILIFYLKENILNERESLNSTLEYFINKNIYTVFLPTDGDNRVECVNPILVTKDVYKEALNKVEEANKMLNEIINNNK